MSKIGIRKLWKYKGEAADYAYYRQRDKITPDAEVRSRLEQIHKWYPDKTPARLQGKYEEVKIKFLSFFRQADMHQFIIMDHQDTGTNVFFGAWAIFGDKPTDEDKLSNPAVIKALGINGSFPPKLVQTGATYSLPKTAGSRVIIDIRIYSSPSNSFIINFRNVFADQALSFKSAEECGKWAAGPNFKY